MSMPSQDCIAAEIVRLEQLKREVPEITLFGDENHCALDAEIMVLRGVEPFTASVRCASSDQDQYVRDHAVAAWNWLMGVSAVTPSAWWEGEPA